MNREINLNPLVSIVIPSIAVTPWLTLAVRSALNQSYQNLEVIVLDSSSDMSVTHEVNSFLGDQRFNIVRNNDPGTMAENWTKAIASTSGDLVKILCDDDLLVNNCIEHQVEILIKFDANVIFSKRNIMTNSGRQLIIPLAQSKKFSVSQSSFDEILDSITKRGRNPFGEPLVMLAKRDSMLKALPFKNEYPYVVDLDFYLRLSAFGSVYKDNQIVGYFRLNAQSASSRLWKNQFSDYFRYSKDVSLTFGSEYKKQTFFKVKLIVLTVIRIVIFKLCERF